MGASKEMIRRLLRMMKGNRSPGATLNTGMTFSNPVIYSSSHRLHGSQEVKDLVYLPGGEQQKTNCDLWADKLNLSLFQMTGRNMIGLLAISHAISVCHSESG